MKSIRWAISALKACKGMADPVKEVAGLRENAMKFLALKVMLKAEAGPAMAEKIDGAASGPQDDAAGAPQKEAEA